MTKTNPTPRADALIARALAPHREALLIATASAAKASLESLEIMLPLLLKKIESGEQMTPKARRRCTVSLENSLSRGWVAEDMQDRTRAAIKALEVSSPKGKS
jgi:hypothetical protein